MRNDQEFNDGHPALANGLILFNMKTNSLGLRLGVAKDAQLTQFAAPDRAYLLGGFKSNSADFVNKFDSSEVGFRFFVFALKDATTDLFLRFMDKGVIDIAYAPERATVDARFTFDLSSHPDKQHEFIECMSALVDARN